MTLARGSGDIGADQPYKMSFTSGGLFLNESIDLAASYLKTSNWIETIALAQSEGLTSLPKEKSKRRVLREITNRLETLSDEELQFLVDTADRQEQRLLLWLSICRAYRLVREFAVEVVQDRYLAYQLEIPIESFELFIEQKAEWDDTLASTADATRVRLRQVAFKIMREAGVISEDRRIQSTYLSTSLRALIEANTPSDLAFFPGVMAEGGKP
ncbi:DUF1819 family protein [Antarctobacter heliothermus]|uniref:Putative inner membrane protein n=1 Tax=Antarctobacter heliothermus TaxID=74033 RepID=A0A239JJJ9_9RHOB|nr:DUF1819 family protein [Antarctobacter heliothermus]SNT06061.1 Putative inner membrane protein [Antarctobacter heliothermus]